MACRTGQVFEWSVVARFIAPIEGKKKILDSGLRRNDGGSGFGYSRGQGFEWSVVVRFIAPEGIGTRKEAQGKRQEMEKKKRKENIPAIRQAMRQTIRQAHGPERSRRAHGPERRRRTLAGMTGVVVWTGMTMVDSGIKLGINLLSSSF
jgi:hypothetical protein